LADFIISSDDKSGQLVKCHSLSMMTSNSYRKLIPNYYFRYFLVLWNTLKPKIKISTNSC